MKRGKESCGREQSIRAQRGGNAGRIGGWCSINGDLEGDAEDIPLAPMVCERIRYGSRGRGDESEGGG